MDLLYSRYSNPMDLIGMYINRGRLGTFVRNFLESEHERKTEAAEKEQEWMLWTAYVHSYSEESYNEWKKRIFNPAATNGNNRDADMTDKDVTTIMDKLFDQSESTRK